MDREHPPEYFRNGSTISDLEFLIAIFEMREPIIGWSDAHYEVNCWDLADRFNIHWHRIQSKARRMFNRGLVDSTSNEYKFHILDKGERILAEHGYETFPKRDAVLVEDRGQYAMPFNRLEEIDGEMFRAFGESLGQEAEQRNLEIMIENVPDAILVKWRPRGGR